MGRRDTKRRQKNRGAAETTKIPWAERLAKTLGQPVDIASLVAFRICFGLLMVGELARELSKGWITKNYVEPTFFFTYPGFSWVRPWAGDGMLVHVGVLIACAGAIAAGIYYRAATLIFAIGFTHLFLLDMAQYLNHFYLITLFGWFLVALSPHRAWSVDAWRHPALRTATVPAWQVWLVRFQLVVVYFYGGIAKLNADWLAGVPMGAWLHGKNDWPPLSRLLEHPDAGQVFAWGGMFFDLLIPFALLLKKTRPWAFVLAIAFHVANHFVFQIGVFPWFMIAATTLFFSPSWPRRAWAWCKERPGQRQPATDTPATDTPATDTPATDTPTAPGISPALFYGLAIFAAAQMLIPLRHWLHPGNPSWTERGHMFAWHMMLRSKTGQARFLVVHPDTGRIVEAPSQEIVTDDQYEEMAGDPDLLATVGQEIARRYRRRGQGNVQVRVYARASLNHRSPQLIVDPDVDLAAGPPNDSWILPFNRMLRDDETSFFSDDDIFTVDPAQLKLGDHPR